MVQGKVYTKTEMLVPPPIEAKVIDVVGFQFLTCGNVANPEKKNNGTL